MVVHDGVELPDEEMEKLGAIGVRIDARHAAGGRRRRTTPSSACGSPTARCSSGEAIVVASKPHVRADYLGPLGIEPQPFEMAGAVLGSVIAVEPTGATAVPGVFAAGNATDISMTLMASAAHGNRVGAWINAELAAADAAQAVEARRDELLRATGVGGALLRRPRLERPGQRRSSRPRPPTSRPGRALDIGCGEGGDAIWLAAAGLGGDGGRLRRCRAGPGRRARRRRRASATGSGPGASTCAASSRTARRGTWSPRSSCTCPTAACPTSYAASRRRSRRAGRCSSWGTTPSDLRDRDAARPPLVHASPPSRCSRGCPTASRSRCASAAPHAGAPADRRGDRDADAVLRARRVA